MIKIKRQIIDIHAHVLPGVDDGAKTMEEACSMLKLAAEQGVVAVIATPHYSRYRQDSAKQQDLARQLQERIRDSYPEFCVYHGQEVCYFEELAESLASGHVPAMNHGRYVLVEFQPMASYQMLQRGTRQVLLAGFLPILAHVERYPCLRQEMKLDELGRSGCRLQMNYESIQGSRFDPDVGWCRRQVQQGKIHLLGSDMHRLDFRSPKLEKALQWLDRHVDGWLIERMTYQNPLSIIKNEQMS